VCLGVLKNSRGKKIMEVSTRSLAVTDIKRKSGDRVDFPVSGKGGTPKRVNKDEMGNRGSQFRLRGWRPGNPERLGAKRGRGITDH